jgi:hypothetical protein
MHLPAGRHAPSAKDRKTTATAPPAGGGQQQPTMRARQRQLPHPSFPPSCALLPDRSPTPSLYVRKLHTYHTAHSSNTAAVAVAVVGQVGAIDRPLAGADRRRLGSRSIHTSQLSCGRRGDDAWHRGSIPSGDPPGHRSRVNVTDLHDRESLRETAHGRSERP